MLGPYQLNTIVTGDARELGPAIFDCQVAGVAVANQVVNYICLLPTIKTPIGTNVMHIKLLPDFILGGPASLTSIAISFPGLFSLTLPILAAIAIGSPYPSTVVFAVIPLIEALIRTKESPVSFSVKSAGRSAKSGTAIVTSANLFWMFGTTGAGKRAVYLSVLRRGKYLITSGAHLIANRFAIALYGTVVRIPLIKVAALFINTLAAADTTNIAPLPHIFVSARERAINIVSLGGLAWFSTELFFANLTVKLHKTIIPSRRDAATKGAIHVAP